MDTKGAISTNPPNAGSAVSSDHKMNKNLNAQPLDPEITIGNAGAWIETRKSMIR